MCSLIAGSGFVRPVIKIKEHSQASRRFGVSWMLACGIVGLLDLATDFGRQTIQIKYRQIGDTRAPFGQRANAPSERQQRDLGPLPHKNIL